MGRSWVSLRSRHIDGGRMGAKRPGQPQKPGRFFHLAFAGLLIQSLRLVLPPSYGVSYALSAVALVLIVVAFKYDRFFKRGGSSTE